MYLQVYEQHAQLRAPSKLTYDLSNSVDEGIRPCFCSYTKLKWLEETRSFHGDTTHKTSADGKTLER